MTNGEMPDGWSRYLRRMTTRPGWSVAKLARDSGIHRSTIFGWIKDGGEGLTIASIRAVAGALGDSVENAAVAALDLVGHQNYDREITEIEKGNVPAQLKAELIGYLRERQAEG